MPSAKDLREFRGFLRNASDRQVQGIYDKEKRAGRGKYADLAVSEAERRGIDLDIDDEDDEDNDEPSAEDLREFRGFLRNATDRQVQGIYDKEHGAGREAYADLAVEEADRRGIDLERSSH